jgi:uncharacterized protein (TIGR03790 family)
MRLLFLLVVAGVALTTRVAAQGDQVVVVYNSRLPESKQVADYYAQRRGVPTNQILGLPLPTGEAMTRQQFIEDLQKPLQKHLEKEKLFVYSPATNHFPAEVEQQKAFRVVNSARVRYAALCYGVPVKISRDNGLAEAGAEKLPVELQRSEAAVDTQLACLPGWEGVLPWVGPIRNPYQGATNSAQLDPTNGLLMVTRLDGPSAAIARGLVDKAIEAETNGFWGRAYFDLRGITNGGYALGDSFIGVSAAVAIRAGFETIGDQKPETFAAGFPMSQIAVYFGWYDTKVSGPFTRPTVEFMPGALAYHLYSFSAQTIRASNESWTAVLLQKGATCTMGMVDEPYLQFTPNVSIWLQGMVDDGYSFGEAAYASQTALSWQTAIIGDPLYRPFRRTQEELQKELAARGSPLEEWSHLMKANKLLAGRGGLSAALAYLEGQPIARRRAVLTEKLGDFYLAQGKMSDAFDMYEGALKRGASPVQRQRLLLSLAEKQAGLGADEKAVGWYEAFFKEFPDYPEMPRLRQQMLFLAKRLGRTNLIEQVESEIRRLSPDGTGGLKKP